MDIQPVFLTMDWVVFLVLLLGGAWLFTALRREYWRIALRQVVANRVAMLSFGILCLYFIVGFLDTLHYKENSGERAGQTLSVLDRICMPLRERVETTYSAPLAIHQYTKETMADAEGHQIRDYPRLK